MGRCKSTLAVRATKDARAACSSEIPPRPTAERTARAFERIARVVDASERKVGIGADEACGESRIEVVAFEQGRRNIARALGIAGKIGELRMSNLRTRPRPEGFDPYTGGSRLKWRVHERHEV